MLVWTAVNAPLPADASANPNLLRGTVACSAASACVVASDYFDSSGVEHGLLLTGSGTSWTAMKAPLPSNAVNGGELDSVTCVPGSVCTAGGLYLDSSQHTQGMLLTGPA